MRLGIIANGDRISFQNAKNKGLDFIEVDRNHPENIEDFISRVSEMQQSMKETGVDISAVGRWGAQIQKDGKIDRGNFSLTQRLLDAAVSVGAKTFICGCNYDPSVSLYQNYSNAIEIFGTLLDQVKDRQIDIAVYNCEWGNFIYSPEQWKVVLGELPNLKIKYDAAHTCGRQGDYLSEINDWANRIAHVHLKGLLMVKSIGWVDFPPAGMDQIDWHSLISLLYAKGYKGDLALEPHSDVWKKGSEAGEKGIDYSIRYFRDLLFA